MDCSSVLLNSLGLPLCHPIYTFPVFRPAPTRPLSSRACSSTLPPPIYPDLLRQADGARLKPDISDNSVGDARAHALEAQLESHKTLVCEAPTLPALPALPALLALLLSTCPREFLAFEHWKDLATKHEKDF